MQRSGPIRSARGRIAIVDPSGLATAACECSRNITEEYERVVFRVPSGGG